MKRSIYISRKVLNSSEIREWARLQGFSSCLPDNNLHVTVAFDRKKHDWSKLPLKAPEKLEIAGTIAVAEFRKGAIVLTLECDTLHARWQELRDWGLHWKHKDYRPHITVTYCLPETLVLENIVPFDGVVILGPEELVEVVGTLQHTIVEQPLDPA